MKYQLIDDVCIIKVRSTIHAWEEPGGDEREDADDGDGGEDHQFGTLPYSGFIHGAGFRNRREI